MKYFFLCLKALLCLSFNLFVFGKVFSQSYGSISQNAGYIQVQGAADTGSSFRVTNTTNAELFRVLENGNIEDTYMAVLWPKAVGKGNDYVLWNQYNVDEKGNKTENLAYKQNAGLDTNGDGSVTKEEVGAVLRDKLQQGEKTRNKVNNE